MLRSRSQQILIIILFGLGLISAGCSVVSNKVVSPPEQTTRSTNTAVTRTAPIREYVSQTDAAKNIPILMYHYIRTCIDPEDKSCPSLSVSSESFSKQMQWFSDNGYTTVGFEYFFKPYKILGQPFIITFDDGYQDSYDAALPIIERYGFTATWYIISDRVGDPEYLTWSEVQDMYQHGMSIGSHTLDHKDLTSLLAADVVRETAQSKITIEQHLGVSIDTFCYPYGRHTLSTETAVQQAGYLTATTTVEGLATFSGDLMQIPRVRMKENIDIAQALHWDD